MHQIEPSIYSIEQSTNLDLMNLIIEQSHNVNSTVEQLELFSEIVTETRVDLLNRFCILLGESYPGIKFQLTISNKIEAVINEYNSNLPNFPELVESLKFEQSNVEIIDRIPKSIKTLKVIQCENLKEIIFTSNNSNLETLELEKNYALSKISNCPNQLENLKVISCVDLTYIKNNSNQLKHIETDNFEQIENIPVTIESLAIKTKSNKFQLPEKLKYFKNLKKIDIQGKHYINLDLSNLPKSIECLSYQNFNCNFDQILTLTHLKQLIIKCDDQLTSIDRIPENLEILSISDCIYLQSITAQNNKLQKLKLNKLLRLKICNLIDYDSNILELYIKYCERIETINQFPSHLKILEFHGPYMYDIPKLPESITRFSISRLSKLLTIDQSLPNLRKLIVSQCENITKINIQNHLIEDHFITGCPNLTQSNII